MIIIRLKKAVTKRGSDEERDESSNEDDESSSLSFGEISSCDISNASFAEKEQRQGKAMHGSSYESEFYQCAGISSERCFRGCSFSSSEREDDQQPNLVSNNKA